MPTPSSSLATLRPDLGSLLEFDLEMNRRKFIAYQVLPIIGVDLAADTFGRIPIEQLLQRADVKRAANGTYNRLEWNFEPDSFATEEFGLEGKVDQRNARKYANYFDAELNTARLVLHQVLLEAELRVAAQLFAPATFTTTPVTNEWDDWDDATPIDDVEACVQRVHAACGIWVNALVINKKVFRNMRNCAQIIERIQAAGAGKSAKASEVSAEQIASVLDLEKVVVADGTYNSANRGVAASLQSIWSDEYAMVCKIATTDAIEEPCIGRTFHWSGDGSQPGGLVESYWEEQSRADIERVRHDVDEKVIYPETAQLLSNITT